MGWEDSIRPSLHSLFDDGGPVQGGIDPDTRGLSPNHIGLAKAERLLRAIFHRSPDVEDHIRSCSDYLDYQALYGHCFDEQCSSIYGLGGFHCEAVAGMIQGAVRALSRIDVRSNGPLRLYRLGVRWLQHELYLHSLSIDGALPGCRSGDPVDGRRDDNVTQLRSGVVIMIPEGANAEPRRYYHAVYMIGRLIKEGDLPALKPSTNPPRLKSRMEVYQRPTDPSVVIGLRCPTLTCYGGPVWEVGHLMGGGGGRGEEGEGERGGVGGVGTVSWRDVAPVDERGQPKWNGAGGGKSMGGGDAPFQLNSTYKGRPADKEISLLVPISPLPDTYPPRLELSPPTHPPPVKDRPVSEDDIEAEMDWPFIQEVVPSGVGGQLLEDLRQALRNYIRDNPRGRIRAEGAVRRRWEKDGVK